MWQKIIHGGSSGSELIEEVVLKNGTSGSILTLTKDYKVLYIFGYRNNPGLPTDSNLTDKNPVSSEIMYNNISNSNNIYLFIYKDVKAGDTFRYGSNWFVLGCTAE